MDDHAFGYHRVTCGNASLNAFHLYNADTASADLIDLLQEAEGGNIDADLFRRLKYCSAVLDGHGLIVYC